MIPPIRSLQIHLVIPLLCLGFLFVPWGATSPTGQDLLIKKGHDHFEMTYQVTLPELGISSLMYLPLARTDSHQTVKIKHIQSPVAWQLVQDTDHGNLAIAMQPDARHSGQSIEICYLVTRQEKKVYQADLTEEDIEKHMKANRLVPRNKTFLELAQKAVEDKETDLERGRALYKHTLERMKYDKSGIGWGRGDALYACDARTGNCTDFHAYFIALCRSLQIPARFAIGFTIPADKDEGSIGGYHCWAEFLAEEQWIPVDISEADKQPELAEYYFGHHPANRLEMTVGRDLVLDPKTQREPINFLVYPHLETDGQLLKPATKYTFRRINE
jgi:hypothetical protein